MRPPGVAAPVLIVAGALFVALSGFAALAGTLPADAALRDAVLGLASPPVVSLMRVVNAAGDWRVLLPGMALVLAFPKARARWWIWLALMVVALGGPDVLKLVVGRARPEDASLGFPSGHATAAAAFFGALAHLAGSLPRPARGVVRAGAFVLIALVGVARVVLRAHWPSDVLAGIALGLALASAAVLISNSWATGGRARSDS